MNKALIDIKDDEINRKVNNELKPDYSISNTYIDEYNYLSLINRYKPDIVIIHYKSVNDYLLLSRLISTKVLVVYLTDFSNVLDVSQLKNLNNFYAVNISEQNSFSYLKNLIDIIFKNYNIIKDLEMKLNKYREKAEENNLVKKAKIKLMKQGMDENKAYNYIISQSMKKRLTKRQMAIYIINDR